LRPITATTDPGPSMGRIEVLQRIFSTGYGDGLEQEILDVIDMALGVYEGDRFMALARTVNPLHYASMILGFLARVPRRLFASLGLMSRSRAAGLSAADVARLEAVAERLADVENVIDARLGAVQDRQAMRHAEFSRQVSELAERLDFAERVLARQRPMERLEAPEESNVTTPV